MLICKLLGMTTFLFLFAACNGDLIDKVKTTESSNFCPETRLADGTCPTTTAIADLVQQ